MTFVENIFQIHFRPVSNLLVLLITLDTIIMTCLKADLPPPRLL